MGSSIVGDSSAPIERSEGDSKEGRERVFGQLRLRGSMSCMGTFTGRLEVVEAVSKAISENTLATRCLSPRLFVVMRVRCGMICIRL